jgi:hypothetical protein
MELKELAERKEKKLKRKKKKKGNLIPAEDLVEGPNGTKIFQ